MTRHDELLAAVRRFRPLALFDGVGVYDFGNGKGVVLVSEHVDMVAAQKEADCLNLSAVLTVLLRDLLMEK